jgi:hypothetical protein
MISGQPVSLHDLTKSGNILSIAILRAFSRFSTSCPGIIAFPFYSGASLTLDSNINPMTRS